MNRPSRLALTLAFWPALLLANEPGPENILRNATDKVLAELNADPEARRDPAKLNLIIEAHILPLVDFVGLSRLTLGKHWGNTGAAPRPNSRPNLSGNSGPCCIAPTRHP